MPAGLFPTLVSTKLCTGGVCRDKQIPVVQAYFASK